MTWSVAADISTVGGTGVALILGFLAYVQYRRSVEFHRENIAQQKLNELFNVALQEPSLADGYFDMSLIPPKNEADRDEILKYFWILSTILGHLEFIYKHYGNDEDYQKTIEYTLSGHKEFILSKFHKDTGWWSTYEPKFRDFVSDIFSINRRETAEWARIPLKPERFNLI